MSQYRENDCEAAFLTLLAQKYGQNGVVCERIYRMSTEKFVNVATNLCERLFVVVHEMQNPVHVTPADPAYCGGPVNCLGYCGRPVNCLGYKYPFFNLFSVDLGSLCRTLQRTHLALLLCCGAFAGRPINLLNYNGGCSCCGYQPHSFSLDSPPLNGNCLLLLWETLTKEEKLIFAKKALESQLNEPTVLVGAVLYLAAEAGVHTGNKALNSWVVLVNTISASIAKIHNSLSPLTNVENERWEVMKKKVLNDLCEEVSYLYDRKYRKLPGQTTLTRKAEPVPIASGVRGLPHNEFLRRY